MMDYARMYKHNLGMYAVTPFIFETTGDTFMDLYYEDSGLMLGEQLYTARGS